MTHPTANDLEHRFRRNVLFQLLMDTFTPHTVTLTVLDVLGPPPGDQASSPDRWRHTATLPEPRRSVEWLR